MRSESEDDREWLEGDGLGGFASGAVNGIRTRRYHALLLTATTPPTGRFVLVNGFDAWLQTGAGSFALSSQRYAPDQIHPDGAQHLAEFAAEPWPRWKYRGDGIEVEQEIFAVRGASVVAIAWRLAGGNATGQAALHVRPFLSGRDPHSLHHENPAFCFDPTVREGRVIWRPYHDLPPIISYSNGEYRHHPDWYHNFLYSEERARGLDFTEDLASPGELVFDLGRGEAVCLFGAQGHDADVLGQRESPLECLTRLRAAETQRRRAYASRLERAVDSYVVRRAEGHTIVAGYPWFNDWGRDTFISIRGLCLATGRLEEARSILLEWSGAVSRGMLPNRFTERGQEPEYNAVDASLWFVIAVGDYLRACERAARMIAPQEADRLRGAVEAILAGYAAGTRYRIRLDDDGLIAAGEPGVQLTWMDAKVGDWVVTPRIGKPVEIAALWLNALKIAERYSPHWSELFTRGLESFRARFWNEPAGYLYDVVDPDHQRGAVDASFRPNQIFAVGGLPLCLLEPAQARRVVDAVEARLLTPLGLRSLAAGESGYCGRYQGGVRERDAAYHQGTVWPWLMGPFAEAWVRVRGGTAEARREATQRFLKPLLDHLDQAGIGHISEIADGDPPHTPRGCPFQAWSVAEALRLAKSVLV
jgi:predicted glycogen debranching enzyme